MESTDASVLAQQTKEGNIEAFAALYDAYVTRLFAFVYYKTHHREAAEDIVSQAFTQALHRIHSFNPARGTFQSWLYQIARNLVADHFRREHPTTPIEDAWDLSATDDIVRDLDMKQRVQLVEQYMQRLSTKEREVVLMRMWQDMSYAEIADATDTSQAAAKMLYARGIKKLRDMTPLTILLVALIRP